MTQGKRCGQCGSHLPGGVPEGLCPRCLLRTGLETQQELESEDALSSSGDDHLTPVPETPGRYKPMGEYSRGGMGRILLVRDVSIGRDIALKELLPQEPAAADAPPSPVRQSVAFVSRFLKEARIAGQLEHPGVVPVYELGQRLDGTVYYTMKLVRGQTLREAIKKASSCGNRLALLPHFLDLCQVIAYAHSRGVIHRDIKPSNVMVGEFGETVVLDWGLAKVRGEEDPLEREMTDGLRLLHTGDMESLAGTVYGQALGTPAYMSPEQARGEIEKVDERSDTYSLGAVLYEILTGSTPFSGNNATEIVTKVTSESPASVPSLVPDAPSELVAICNRAMAREPDLRYASAKDLAEEIQRFQSGLLVSAYRYGPLDLLLRFVGQHRAVLSVVIGAVILLAALGTYSWLRIVQEKNTAISERDRAEKQQQAADLQRSRAEGAREVAEAAQAKAELERSAAEQAREAERQQRVATEEARQNEEAQRLAAETSRHEAEAARADSEKRAIEASSRLAENYYYQSQVWLLDREDVVRALLYACKALSEVPPNQPAVAAYALWAQRVVLRLPQWSFTSGGTIVDAAFSPDGQRLLLSSWWGTTLFDVKTSVITAELKLKEQQIRRAVFSPDGKRVLATSQGSAQEYDALTGEALGETMKHEYGMGYLSQAFPAYSPDGRLIVTALGNDNSARLWESGTGKPVGEPMQHASEVKSAAFSPDSRQVITASSDGTARIWDATTGKPVSDPISHLGSLTCACFSPDGQYIATACTGSFKTVVLVRDARTLDRIGDPIYHRSEVTRLAFSPDSRWLLTASLDRTALVSRSDTGGPVCPLMEHEGGVAAASFSRSGRWIITGTRDGRARVWEAATGKQVGSAMKHESTISSAVFSPDERFLLTASGDGCARIWDLPVKEEIGSSADEGHQFARVTPSPYGDTALTFTQDFVARLYRWSTGDPIGEPMTSIDERSPVSFSSDGRWMVSGSTTGSAQVWATATGTTVGAPLWCGGEVAYAAFSADGRLVATVSNQVLSSEMDKGFLVWQQEEAEPPAYAEHDSQAGKGKEGSKKGHWTTLPPSSDLSALSAYWKGWAQVWETDGGKPLGRKIELAGLGVSVAFSTDGTAILVKCLLLDVGPRGCQGHRLDLWDFKSGKTIGKTIEPGRQLPSTTLSPDAHTIITTFDHGGGDSTDAILWDVASGNAIGQPLRHSDDITSASFSPDSRLVVTSSEDGTAQVWEARTGLPVGDPLGHRETVFSASFSPDGRWVLTASIGGSAKVWETTTGKAVTEPLRHWSLDAAWFRPDGRHVVTVSSYPRAVKQWEIGATIVAVPEWMKEMAEPLTGMRLAGGDKLEPIPYEDCLARRRALLDRLREAAIASDEAAQFVLRKWDPHYAGVWQGAPTSEQ